MCKEEVVSNLKYSPGNTERTEENYKIQRKNNWFAGHNIDMGRANARSRFMLLHRPIHRTKHDLNWFRALEGWDWNTGSLPSRIDLPVQRNHSQIHPIIHIVLANCLRQLDRMLWRLVTFNSYKSIWRDLPATITITRPAAHALCTICISTHSSCTGLVRHNLKLWQRRRYEINWRHVQQYLTNKM
jgi:hypothetical protein